MKPLKRAFLISFLGLLLNGAYGQIIPEPADILGFSIGDDRKLAGMHQILDYFRQLDVRSSRIRVQEVGKTTMGNPFIVAIITSGDNHKKLERYKKYQQLLADPRRITEEDAGEMIEKGKAVVMINCSIHASEIGASQMSMKLAYDLAVKNDPQTKEILENVILLLIPMHNPDGIRLVVDWYEKNLGTQYEGCRMPWLYHKYVGHDNNRDWYMFTQVESRLTLKVHNAWHPHIVVDMHQMGNRGPRMFVPPYIDPYEPNVDPILRQEVAAMGTFIASELTSEGKAGVAHSIGFDAWTPARAYHHYHGGIRILTEAASVKVATPVTIEPGKLSEEMKQASVRMPLPWKGGEWTLKDIVEYDYSAAFAALTNAAGLRSNWLRNFYSVHKNAVAPEKKPFAFLVPSSQRDMATTMKMLRVFRLAGVEVHRADTDFSAAGHLYPAGTRIIFTAQPYGSFAKTLLEIQKYPEIREYPGGPLKSPYDVVAHTLPLLMGVDTIAVEDPFRVETSLLRSIEMPDGSVSQTDDTYGYVWSHATNDSFIALNRILNKGYTVYWNAESVASGEEAFPEGSMIVLRKEGLSEELREIAAETPVHFEALECKPEGEAYRLTLPKLGLYKSWTASMDEGWTRWVLEKFEIPYQSVSDKDVRWGELNKKWNVLVIPDMNDAAIVKGLSEKTVPSEYAGGIGETGVKSLAAFVRSGGTLIAVDSASDFCIKRFHLGVENSAARKKKEEFFIPGSILKVLNDGSHPIAYGYPRDAAVFFRRSPVFSVGEGLSVVRYPGNPFLSGWINGEEHLANKSAIVDIPYEKGRIILIGFPVLYRGQAHGTFRYFFNAVYYGAASMARWP